MTKQRIANMPDDDWRAKNPEFQGERLEYNLELAKLLSISPSRTTSLQESLQSRGP